MSNQTSRLFDGRDGFRMLRYSASTWLRVSLALVISLAWWPRLFRSFWVDEAGTYFVAHQGWQIAFQRSSESAGQSILYGVIASLFCYTSVPWKELVLRLPSVIAIGLAAVFLYKLAEHLIGRGSGAIAVCAFLVDPWIIMLGTNARPYALAMAACIVSGWAYLQWIETRRKKHLVIFVTASILTLYLHYFFAFVFIVQLSYLLFLVAKRELVPWKLALAAFGGIGLSLWPLLPHLQLLLRESGTLSFAGKPDVTQLAEALAPGVLVVAGTISAFMAKLLPRTAEIKQAFLSRRHILFLSLWWLVGPAVFFAVGTFTPFEVFVARYISFARPAVSLVIACFVCSILAGRERTIWMLAFVSIIVFNPITLQSYWRPGKYECGPALRIAEQRAGASSVPILLTSDLPESNYQDWMQGVKARPHLYAALIAYPKRNPIYGLPYHVDEKMQAYMRRLTAQELRSEPRMVLVSALPATVKWVGDYLHSVGYASTTDNPNSYAVVTFQRSASAPSP